MKKVSGKYAPRDVSPFFRWLRERLIGRKYRLGTHLRFEPEMSDRTQPDPNLPEGVAHKLFGNYYFLRDPRRAIERPLQIMGPDDIKKLPLGASQDKRLTQYKIGVLPGKLYDPPAEPTMPIINPDELQKQK